MQFNEEEEIINPGTVESLSVWPKLEKLAWDNQYTFPNKQFSSILQGLGAQCNRV